MQDDFSTKNLLGNDVANHLDSDNIKTLVNVIFRRKPLHSYSGIRP